MDRTRVGRFSKQAQKNIQRSGAIASGLLDLIPFVGAGRAAAEGDYGSAAMQGLLDVAPVGKAVGLAAAPLMGAIRVFHGSPHTFDKFDMSKIGTGEGAQAYGHGLYFAESPDVARGYQKNLSGGVKTFVDNSIPKVGTDIPHHANMFLTKTKNVEDAVKGLKTTASMTKNVLDAAKSASAKSGKSVSSNAEYLQTLYKDLSDSLSWINKNKQRIKIAEDKGQFYEVNLRWPDAARETTDPLGPQHFLDYDKPLSEQSKFVQDALAKIGYSVDKTKVSEYDDALLSALSGKDVLVPKEPFNPSGERIINRLTNTFGDKVAASERLRSAGIPGVRYLDAMSRGKGGTSNYVTFDDQLAEILRRNPGLLE
jgi:hypothetical protein